MKEQKKTSEALKSIGPLVSPLCSFSLLTLPPVPPPPFVVLSLSLSLSLLILSCPAGCLLQYLKLSARHNTQILAFGAADINRPTPTTDAPSQAAEMIWSVGGELNRLSSLSASLLLFKLTFHTLRMP